MEYTSMNPNRISTFKLTNRFICFDDRGANDSYEIDGTPDLAFALVMDVFTDVAGCGKDDTADAIVYLTISSFPALEIFSSGNNSKPIVLQGNS
jgi:hypothetical protein